MIRKAFAQAKQSEQEEKERQATYGTVKLIIHADFHGHRFIAVGSELHYQPIENCETFTDFLWTYLGTVLNKEWCNAELAKPYDLMHPVAQWHVDRVRYTQSITRNESGLFSAPFRGSIASLTHLAYDLYTLRHNSELQDELVRRLKHQGQFQGARYEALAAATFVRAGFDISFEDERDPKTKHPEFIATHQISGQKIALEAKSKHWSGVLGYGGDVARYDISKPNVNQLVHSALRKNPTHPYVVFVDLNLPPYSGAPEQMPWYRKISRLAEGLGKSKDGAPGRFALLIFTNFSYHYVKMECEDELEYPLVGAFAECPNIPLQNPECLSSIREALFGYNHVPTDFPDV